MSVAGNNPNKRKSTKKDALARSRTSFHSVSKTFWIIDLSMRVPSRHAKLAATAESNTRKMITGLAVWRNVSSARMLLKVRARTTNADSRNGISLINNVFLA